MIICTLCGATVEVLGCVAHVDDHIKTLVRTTCNVVYDIVSDDVDSRIIISYSPYV